MKKYIFLSFTLIFFISCEKEPDLSEVIGELVTYTQYDASQDFSRFSTFYIADKVLVISNDIMDEAEYLSETAAKPMLNKAIAQMRSRGYKLVKNKTDANIGLQISIIKNYYCFSECNNPYWWNSYPWYWEPCFWGNWNSWYYPYPNLFYYVNGSLLIDMVLLSGGSNPDFNELPVIWQAYSIGVLQGNYRQQILNAVYCIEQSFKQSPYLLSNYK